MAEFYSDQEVARMCKPRLLAAAASALAWLSLLGAGLSAFILLRFLPAILHGQRAMARHAGRPMSESLKCLIQLTRMLHRQPMLAALAVVPPLVALALAYLWRSRLCSLLSILLSLAVIASPILLLLPAQM